MATDTARVELELASGRNEITAPFYQTAQRRRTQHEPDAASVGAPASAPRLNATRPPWIVFAGALLLVAVSVWWIMAQRLPEIDPRDVIARNLNNAQTAMADGRYTDPSERSAFHYYSTVLALDPHNAEAIAGIDAIAGRHLTEARVLLANGNIAEAGVALEKARRVRPDHNGLMLLETQWRAELREMLAASTIAAKTFTGPVVKPATTRKREPASQRADVAPAEQTFAASAKVEKPAPQSAAEAPDIAKPTPAPAEIASFAAASTAMTAKTPLIPSNDSANRLADKAANSSTTKLASAVAEPEGHASQAGATIVEGPNIVKPAHAPMPADPAPIAPSSAEPKLIKMVQPRYPQEALMRGLEGWVEVSLQVSPAGDVIEPRVEDSSRGRMFNRAALNAVQQWKYEPRSDGAPSERVRVRLQFQQSD